MANATVYLVAAILHWGARIPLGVVVLAFPQPIRPATIVEAAIGVALAAGAMALLARSGSAVAWAAYVFGLAGTLFGLTIGLLRRLPSPDIWVHGVMLAGLAGGFAVLLAARGHRGDSFAVG